MITADERKAREKRLQDERFSEGGSRGVVDRAYAITAESHGYYRRRLAADAPGRRILEIGSGLGESALALAEAGGIVTGIDLSDVAVDAANEKARARGLRASFEAMDAESTRFSDRSFDIVCGGAIIHHLDTDRAYREIARLLAPNGYAIFLEPLGYNPFINLYRRLTPGIRTPDEHPLLDRDLELATRYFGDVRISYYYLTTLLALPVARTRAGATLVRAGNAIDRILFRLFPALRRQAWFIVLELRQPTGLE